MNVKEMIAIGETDTIEFKVDISPKAETYLKTVVAFANGNGGTIVFGVADKTHEVVGFDRFEAYRKQDDIANTIFDSCHPKITPRITTEIVDSKWIILVYIPAGMERPYAIKSQGPFEGVYVRFGGTTRKVEPYRVQEMTLETLNRSFDQQKTDTLLNKEQIDSLCDRLYKHALARVPAAEEHLIRKIGLSQLLSWKLVIESDQQLYATHGFKLLNGDLDDYPDAWIQCAVFKGNTRATFLTRRDCRGPIDEQIEEAYTFVLEHINVGMRIEGIQRQDVYEFPPFSIRELIANAVCHRSYMSSGKIQVAIYNNRLEITSPGQLDRDQTIDKIRNGQSRLRNKGIAEVFSYMRIIEAWGSGIPRVIEEVRDYGLRPLELIDMGSDFRVNLYRPIRVPEIEPVNEPVNGPVNEPVNEPVNHMDDDVTHNVPINVFNDEISIITQIMKDNPNVTIQALCVMLNKSQSTIKRYIREMKSQGIIYREGSDKTGQWRIKDNGTESDTH